MTHTPPPWKLILHGNEVYPYPLSIHTANDEKWITRDGTVSSLANAHLIAAAPDLLIALAAIRYTWAGHSEQCETVLCRHNKKCDCDWPDIAAQCDAAIAKANGETA